MTRSRPILTPAQVMQRAMRWDFVAAAVVAVGAAVIGWFVAAWTGALSGLIGGAIVAALTAITATAVRISGRRASGPENAIPFIVVITTSWLLKLIVFVGLVLTLSHQSWVQPTVLFLAIIVGIVASLMVEILVIVRSRVLYVPDGE
ncbi:MAG: hypothetical protein FWD85_05275 [Microbacteriaceae bacterium]|nr:hypothetical protein [Microbacteriaceae bacterium]MCL2794702.1 hypothetical protein [Microbacteriaceae bacterium]